MGAGPRRGQLRGRGERVHLLRRGVESARPPIADQVVHERGNPIDRIPHDNILCPSSAASRSARYWRILAFPGLSPISPADSFLAPPPPNPTPPLPPHQTLNL